MLETTFSFNDDFEPKGGNCLHFTVGTSDVQMINSFWCGGGLIEDRRETFSWVGCRHRLSPNKSEFNTFYWDLIKRTRLKIFYRK